MLAGKVPGKSRKTWDSACNPPADAPMATTSKRRPEYSGGVVRDLLFRGILMKQGYIGGRHWRSLPEMRPLREMPNNPD